MDKKKKSEEKNNSKNKEEIKEKRSYRHSKKYYNYKRNNKSKEKSSNKKTKTSQNSKNKNNNRRTYKKRTNLIQERIKILQLAKKNIDEEEENNNKKEIENKFLLTDNEKDFKEIKNNDRENNLLFKSLQIPKINKENAIKNNLVNKRYIKKIPSKNIINSPKIIKKYQTSTFFYKKDSKDNIITCKNNNKYNINTYNKEKEKNNNENKNDYIEEVWYKPRFIYQNKTLKDKIESPKNSQNINSYIFTKAKSKKNIYKNNLLIKSHNNIKEAKEDYDSQKNDIVKNTEKGLNHIYIPKKIQHNLIRGTSQENVNNVNKHNYVSSNITLKSRYKSYKKIDNYSNKNNASNNNINININNNIKIITYNKKIPHWKSNKKNNDFEIIENKIDEEKFDLFKDNISDISSIESRSYVESETTENNNKLNVYLNNIYKTKSIFHPKLYRKKKNNNISEKDSSNFNYSNNLNKINDKKNSRNTSVPHFIFKKRNIKDIISEYNNKSLKNSNQFKNDENITKNIKTINSNISNREPKFYEFVVLEEKLKNIIDKIDRNSNIISFLCFDYLNNFNESSFLIAIEKLFENKNLKIIKNYIKYLVFSIIILYDYCLESIIDENNKFLIQEIFSLNFENIFHLYEYIISKEKSKNQWSNIIKTIIHSFKKQRKYIYSSSTNINYQSIFDKIKNNTKYIRQIINRVFSNSKKISDKIMPFFRELENKSFVEIKQFFELNIFQSNYSYGYIYPHFLYSNNKEFVQEIPIFTKKINTKQYTLFIGLEETLLNYKIEKESHMNESISLRPGVIQFFTEIHQYYEIIIFSLSDKKTVDYLANSLDKSKKFLDNILYRENLKIINDEFVLDITEFSRDLNKIVVVGNIPQIYQKYKDNSINIKSYCEEDLNDNILIKLIGILKRIVENKGNIPEIILKYKDEIIKNITIGSFNY